MLKRLFNIGIEKDMTPMTKARVVILNQFCVIMIFITFIDLLVYFPSSTIYDFVTSFCVVIYLSFFPLLNYLGKNRTAQILFHLTMPIFICTLMVLYGTQVYAELLLMLIVTLGFVAFKEKSIQIALIFWNLLLYTIGYFWNAQYGCVIGYESVFADQLLFAILLILMVTLLSRFIINTNHLFAQKLVSSKKKSESLLLNLLPENVIYELNENGKSEAQLIENATVLITDFVDFTHKSEMIDAEDLVEIINEIYTNFDKIMQRYGIEKIMTIGDAYFAVGGINSTNSSKVDDVIRAAIDMKDYINGYILKRKAENLPFFDVRIAIHTGTVVAGIVGLKKIQYDIWGKAVNVVNLIEKNGSTEDINISENVFELIHDRFNATFYKYIQFEENEKLAVYTIGA